MKGHPANRDRQIQAVRDSGHDPKVGTWPGDPGFEGDGSVSGAELRGDECFGVLDNNEVAALLLVYVAGDTPPIGLTLGRLAQKGLLRGGRLTDAGRSCVARILA